MNTFSTREAGWEAQRRNNMIARCPKCGRRGTVFVRSSDGSDLVCKEDA